MRSDVLIGDVMKHLPRLADESIQTCVTSPPYWGLRDYGVRGQIGLERTVEGYVSRLVDVFREVRRVLKPDGTLWLNLGDSYTSGGRGRYDVSGTHPCGTHPAAGNARPAMPTGLKPKDLVGIPWRVALALQADGWYLRSDIIWHKPNCIPSSVKDRPTSSHEHLFLLAKSRRYFYDADAIREPATWPVQRRNVNCTYQAPGQRKHTGLRLAGMGRRHVQSRNKRDVWTISTKPFKGAHFATFPTKLVEPCILAGSRPGDWVLDPFAGALTVGLVAEQLGRHFLGIELNPEYVEMGRSRLGAVRAAAA